MTERIENIVTTDTEGHGYRYASLSDIAKQGFEIPKMKTETDPVSHKEYVYYFDKELKEWIRGAQVVIPEGTKMMNSAQLYGSALSYARRYTTLLADSLACEDDQAIEELAPTNRASDKQIAFMKKLYTNEEIAQIMSFNNIEDIRDLDKEKVSKYIEDRAK